MKSYSYSLVSETSETTTFLHFLRSALLMGKSVGNVGNNYNVSYVPTPPLRRLIGGAK